MGIKFPSFNESTIFRQYFPTNAHLLGILFCHKRIGCGFVRPVHDQISRPLSALGVTVNPIGYSAYVVLSKLR